MILLIKYPTRSRPQKFLEVLNKMVQFSSHRDKIHYLISYDLDDHTMTQEIFNQAQAITPNILFVGGTSKSKVEAINRDMAEASKLIEWDIVMVASDDMDCQVNGWDEIIRQEFKDVLKEWMGEATPPIMYNLDKALWFFDGHQHRICTLTIMGRARYERFGYLYHPSYISLWCDNEWTDVNMKLGMKHFPDIILFKHEHPAWGGGVPTDELYRRNEAYFKTDQDNYERRKAINFELCF